jgi:hypothetical protein
VTERTETAFHEAGHEAALYALGFDLGEASIVASEEHLGLMGTPIDQDLVDRLAVMRDLGEDRQKFFVRQIAVAFAGVKAEEILTGREHDPRSSDTQTWLPGSDWYRLQLWLPLAAEDPDEQPEVCDQAWDEAERVLRENWDAVRALAEALLEHEELDAAAVRSVLEETGCARDEAPIRRVFLEVEGERLRERRSKLMSEGDPENELEALQERIASMGNELDLLRPEEKES